MPPLPLPADPATVPVAELAVSPAVALFVDRARAVRPGFAPPRSQRGGGGGDLPAGWRASPSPWSWRPPPAAGPPACYFGRLRPGVAGRAGDGHGRHARNASTLRATGEWSVAQAGGSGAVAAGGRGGARGRLTVEAAGPGGSTWTRTGALELTEALARHSLILPGQQRVRLPVPDAGDHPRVRRRAGGPARRAARSSTGRRELAGRWPSLTGHRRGRLAAAGMPAAAGGAAGLAGAAGGGRPTWWPRSAGAAADRFDQVFAAGSGLSQRRRSPPSGTSRETSSPGEPCQRDPTDHNRTHPRWQA